MDKEWERIIFAWSLTYMTGVAKLGYALMQRNTGSAPRYCIIKPFWASAEVTSDTEREVKLLPDMRARKRVPSWAAVWTCISIVWRRLRAEFE